MTVYLSSVDQELLYAIRAIEVLLESGVGVAEAMKHVADEDYGDLSGVFKQIFRDTDSGRAFGDSIRTQSRKTDSAGLRRVLTTLVMSVEEDTNVIDRLRSIAEKEARDRRIELDGFIERLSGVSEQFLILSILGPLIVVIGAVISGILNDDHEGLGWVYWFVDDASGGLLSTKEIVLSSLVCPLKQAWFSLWLFSFGFVEKPNAERNE